ncbi:Phox/Bem1p [Corchorus capsularis]|uniref:Phox/Bem1p n=1 Tax=Corchorus capsularis TaxID=210143 RepID=A0A1R3JW06_COCAP|nr:Phox/Bem1p [Corchorus capsularis]
MIGEASSPSDQLVQQESMPVVPNVGKNVNNSNHVSVRTGEEFSIEFLQECTGTGRIPAIPDASQMHEFNQNQNHQLGYQDLARILGLQRMDSECASDISDFASLKESFKGSENGSFAEKLSRYQKEDGEIGQVARKAFGELNCDRSHPNGFGSTTPPIYPLDSPSSSNFSGQGASDGSQSGKMKFLCSFGGKILPRPSDSKLRYVGGETRIISISKSLSWGELVRKTSEICNQPHSIKYQLPGEDLDALISVSSDEDLQHMIEEYHGLEKLGGSQRLRIFLIPLGESEVSSSLEASTIQQTTPDYQYVVAVNGIADPSPKKNSGGQCLPTEGSQLGPSLDHNPSFHNRCPTSVIPLETKDGVDALHPSQVFNNSKSTRSPVPSPSISPLPFQHEDSKSVQGLPIGNSSSIESNTSFITAHLNPDNHSTETLNFQHAQQVPPALIDYNHPYVKAGADQTYQAYGEQFQNPDPSDSVTFLVLNKNNIDCNGVSHERFLHKERPFLSEKPISHAEDPLSLLSGSVDSIDSHPGMSHAFSDSKLQEHGGKSAYCSQEGMSPSSPLTFAKTRSPSLLISNAVQERLVQQHDNIDLMKPRAQNNDLSDTESTSKLIPDMLHCSPHPEPFGKNEPIHKGTDDSNDKCQTAKSDLSISSFMTLNNSDDYTSSLNARNRSSDKSDLFLHQGANHYGASVEYNSKLFDPDCHLTSGFGVDSQKKDLQVSEMMVPSSLATKNIMEHPLTLDKTKYDIVEYGGFSEKVIDARGNSTSCTSNPEVTSLFIQDSRGESSQGNLISGSLYGPMSHGPVQLQCIANQKDISEEDKLMSSTNLHPPAVRKDSGLSSNLLKDDLHAMSVNPANTAVSRRGVSLIDDDLNYHNQNAEKMAFIGSVHKNSIGEDLQFAQTIPLSKNKYEIQPESVDIVEDVTTSVPSGIQVSSAVVPRVDVMSSDIISPIGTELEYMIPESESEDATIDGRNKDESFSDAMIAEMEASIYGLQIIKNADLEELRELGSGTYGTVYHGKWRGTDVAIKRIKKSCFSGRSSEQDRLTKDFWREAQILSNLHHPNVVAFYGVVPDGTGGTLATVTEYMVNGSLRNVLLKNNRSLDRRRKLIIAMDAAFGMEYLHSKNIVHFDLKCDNLLVNLRDPQRPICKVGDFGLSRIKRNTLVSGGVRGTLPWMAPELLNGSSNRVSEKVDVFSFGISMWEILTGEEPYADMHCGAIIGGIVKNTLRPPIPERCDPDWRKLMEQCWSPDPESRPSFTEITDRLRTMSLLLQPKGPSNHARQVRPNVTA